MRRHELRDGAGEPVIGTPNTYRSGGRHRRQRPQVYNADVAGTDEPAGAPTDRILTEPLRWLQTPTEELWTLVDTQPIPVITHDEPAFNEALPQRVPHQASGSSGGWEPPLDHDQLEHLLEAMKRKWRK